MDKRSLKLKDSGLCVETSSQQRAVNSVASADTITPTKLASAEFAGQSLIKQRIARAQKNPTRSLKNQRRDPRARPRLEQELRQSRAGSASQSSALTWARAASDDCPGETSRTETAAVLEVADQLPTVMASKRSTEEREPLLDTGASHLLMNLDHLTEEQAAEAKRIHVNQATGSPKRALLLNGVIYAADVGRVLVWCFERKVAFAF